MLLSIFTANSDILKQVCTRLQKLVDAKSSTNLWACAPLLDECSWVSSDNRKIIERAAGCGNVEALIKLAVAYLYDEGGELSVCEMCMVRQ